MLTLATLAGAAAAPAQQALTVDFEFDPDAPRVGAPTTFLSTSTSQATIVRESWDFTSDGRVDGTGQSVTVTFADAGQYAVTLEVEDAAGRVKRTLRFVDVAPVTGVAPATPPPAQPPPPASAVPTTAAPLMAPFPTVRIAGSYSPAGIQLSIFSVTAPAGTTVSVRCSGQGCPYRERGPLTVRAAGTLPAGAARRVNIVGFASALLQPGVRIKVYIAHRHLTGKYTRFTIRRGAPLRVDRCLRPSGLISPCWMST